MLLHLYSMLMPKKCLTLLTLLLLPYSLLAWGVLGHRAIGRIAENHLTLQARRQMQRLLGTETLPLITIWPDEIRSDPQYAALAVWHYVNVAPNLPFSQYASQLAASAPQPGNAYTALQQQLKNLKDPAKTPAERLFALKWVAHLVGDVHMPLHAGRAEDHDGNLIAVSWRGHDTNLHAIWDSDLVEYPGLSWSEIATAYDHATPAQIKQWQQDSVATWLFESYQLCPPIYAGAAQSTQLDYRYYPTFGPTVEQRLVQAGIRLAGVLNAAFGG